MNRTCPKCGFRQNGGDECRRCGLIFARYKKIKARVRKPAPAAPLEKGGRAVRDWLKLGYLVLSWVSLGAVLLVAVLVLKQSPQPEIDTAPQAEEWAEAKLLRFQNSVSWGRPDRLTWNEAELNAWLGANLAVAAPPVPEPPMGNPRTNVFSYESELRVQEMRSTVRDVKIDLLTDRLRAYVTFELYGKDLSLLLEGRISTENGYLRLEPTRGMLGSLPLPKGTLESAVRRLFDSPENREKFRLPASIKEVAIEEGQLVIRGGIRGEGW